MNDDRNDGMTDNDIPRQSARSPAFDRIRSFFEATWRASQFNQSLSHKWVLVSLQAHIHNTLHALCMFCA